jgi:hypothetical protein
LLGRADAYAGRWAVARTTPDGGLYAALRSKPAEAELRLALKRPGRALPRSAEVDELAAALASAGAPGLKITRSQILDTKQTVLVVFHRDGAAEASRPLELPFAGDDRPDPKGVR